FELSDPRDQVVGNRLIERESQIALLARVGQESLLQARIAMYWWVQADVVLEGREMDQHSLLLERRHSIADRLLGVGRGGADREPDLFENRLDLRRKCRDVFVDVRRHRPAGFHAISLSGFEDSGRRSDHPALARFACARKSNKSLSD